MKKVYLAGQPNEYDNNWKELFKDISECDFHDWEFDSDQTSPDTFFPDDLNGVKLIIIWQETRNQKWSIEFVKKTGFVVRTFEEAKMKLCELLTQDN